MNLRACVPSRMNRGSDSEKPTLSRKPGSRKGGLRALPQTEIRFDDDEEQDDKEKEEDDYGFDREFSLVDFPEEMPMSGISKESKEKIGPTKSKTVVSKGNDQKSVGDS